MIKEKQRVYFVIDMKSFFASVECAERGLDAMTTKLVVADKERTDVGYMKYQKILSMR